MSSFNQITGLAKPRSHLTSGTACTSTRAIVMSNREPVNFHSSLRQLPGRRRRVGVQALADVFIRSLVVASFCPDHNKNALLHSGVGGTRSNKSRVEAGPSVIHGHQRGKFERRFIWQPTVFSSFHPTDHSRLMSTNAAQNRLKTDEEQVAQDLSTKVPPSPPSSHADERPESDIKNEEDNYETEFPQSDPEHDATEDLDEDEDEDISLQDDQSKHTKSRPPKVSIMEFIKRTRSADVITANMLQDEYITDEPDDFDDPRWRSVDIITFLTALHDKSKSNQFVFTCYKKLPYPGVQWLHKKEIKILLRRFAKPLDRRRSHARYYLQLVQDMIAAKLEMNRWHWTNALYFTAHKVPVLEKRDLNDALALWRQMETMGNVKSDSAIFELLYSIAIKARQYTVADNLLKEMENRGLKLTRHGMVSKIFACGRRYDLDGVQDTFDEFVRSGGIVDTTVLNALLSSLLHIGALDAAKQLYTRMMKAHESGITEKHPHRVFAPSTMTEFGSWRQDTLRLGGIFKRYSRLRHEYEENPEKVQDLVPLSPDTRTFHIVFSHHCLHTGDLKEVCQVIKDMETVFTIPPQSFIYNFLFLGFSIHGPSKGWTKERLQEVWVVFRRLLYESETRLAKLESGGKLIEARWENPLKSSCKELLEQNDDDEEEGQQQPKRRSVRVLKRPLKDNDENVDEEDFMKKFDNMGHYRRSSYLDDSTPRRLENTILLSRGLNIAILKAFGAHVGSKELIHIYAQIERIWKPWKRLPSDAHAVKNELDRQLARARQRERDNR